MKFIIVFVAVFALAVATPNREAQTNYFQNDVEPENYKYSVGTSDGITAEEEGHLENQGTEDEGIVVRGSYSYVGYDGQTYSVTYIADKNGFQPQGAHIPQA